MMLISKGVILSRLSAASNVTSTELSYTNSILTSVRKSLHTTSVMNRKTAGRHKVTINKDKPLTYEQSQRPNLIGVTKSWNSINSTGFLGGLRQAETAQEDVFIRKFMIGTWSKLITSEVIIKRRANQIFLCFIVKRSMQPSRMNFLIGYTEEILSCFLKSIVKLEVQTIESSEDMVYKYI